MTPTLAELTSTAIRLCQLAYDQDPKHGYACHYEGEGESEILFVACKGSASVGDWVQNLRFITRKRSVHRGFFESALKMNKQLLLSKYIPNLTVYCGHSQGGAEASVMQKLHIDRNEDVYGKIGEHEETLCITFGSPRPGDRVFARSCEKFGLRQYNFIHGSDKVPYTPPWILGYRRRGNTIILPDIGPRPLDMIDDHNLDNYKIATERYFMELGK